MNPATLARLKSISEKIAIEFVFAEPGKDIGLLPVNCLVADLESLALEEDAPEAINRGVAQARQWIDQIFESSGTFSAESLKRFGEWTVWWQSVVIACENQIHAPSMPAEWALPEAAAAPGRAPVSAAPAEPASKDEPVMELKLPQDRELLNEFIQESQEHLQNIEHGVLVLEDNPTDAGTLDSIFRAFHTFKGGSGFLNLTAIQRLAHELESLLDQARQHKLQLTPPVINLILEGGDTLKLFVAEIGARLAGPGASAPVVVPTRDLLHRIRAVLAGETTAAAAAPVAETVNITPAAPRPDPANNAAAAALGTSVKVDTLKLDTLVDLVGEMVIAQSLVIQNPELNSLQNEQLTRDLAHLGRITRDLQRTAMSLRMVPVGATFHKMNRLVRDLAAKVGKQVQLVTEGDDTELDRTIVEEISDPLIHMVRNSVDHGIEDPETRQQRGKPPQGTICLKAFHQGGNIVIEIKDDGKGLDRDRILAKAIERGLAKPGEPLSTSQIFKMILEPGFSTAEKVTDLSGRGVGMDVVQRNIEKLRGKLEIQSGPGQGTTFSIHLPLTLAIIDGLLVGVGSHRFIVPTLLVRESFRPTAQMISTVQGRGELVNVRGRLCPLLRLYHHLAVTPASTDPAQSIVLVVESGSDIRCVMVDKLLGKQEVVIKSLGETFRHNPYVAGAVILGDGGVGLILDPQSLVHLNSQGLAAAA